MRAVPAQRPDLAHCINFGLQQRDRRRDALGNPVTDFLNGSTGSVAEDAQSVGGMVEVSGRSQPPVLVSVLPKDLRECRLNPRLKLLISGALPSVIEFGSTAFSSSTRACSRAITVFILSGARLAERRCGGLLLRAMTPWLLDTHWTRTRCVRLSD